MTSIVLNRRNVLFAGASLAGLAACASSSAVALGDPTLVPTTYGSLRGVKTDDGVIEFLGVRYARPPVGPLRFRAPVKPSVWQGEQAAAAYGEASIQMRAGAGAAGIRHACRPR